MAQKDEKKLNIKDYQYQYRKEYESAKEKKQAYDKLYYQRNKAKKLAQMQEWSEKNREHSRAIKKKYSDNNRLKWRIYCFNRRNKVNITPIKIELSSISNWDSRICGVCTEFIADKYHLDHIIPLSKGGLHEVGNIQLTHPLCNLKKYNKLVPAGAF